MADHENRAEPSREAVPQLDDTSSAERDFRGRDVMSLTLIGVFFLLVAVLVLAGQFFGQSSVAARIVNFVAGMTLLTTAAVMIAVARRIRAGGRSANPPSTPSDKLSDQP